MPSKFNIGIVGAGMWGKTHMEMFQKEGRATVSWACDIDPAALKAAQKKFAIPHVTQELSPMLSDPALDAVVIATPPYTHAAIALQVFQAGKHMVIEKPMVINRKEIHAILEAAQSHPELVVLEGSCRHTRLNPKFGFVRDFILSGKLGRIYHIHHQHLVQGTFVEYNPNGKWAMDKRLAGGGPFLDWGEYDLSFHLGVLDDLPELQSIHSFTQGGLRDLSRMAPVVDVEMHGAALMEFKDGLTYYYERGAGSHGETRNETRLYGTLGGLHFYYPTWEPVTVEYFHSGEHPARETLSVDMSRHPAHDDLAFVSHFVDCLAGKDKPRMPVTLAAKHLEILLKVLED